MNTTQLECFMAVSNFLNFSRAAEHLRITQPAVSHQISTLEDELGVKLFHRTSKSVRLTQEGYLFTQYADEILKLTGLSLARMRQSQHELPTRLGIGCRNTAELRLLQPALERLRREDAAVLPLLRLIPFDSLKNLLMDGEIQVMFSFQENLAKTTRYQPLTNCPVACVCAQDHPLAQFQQLTLEQLKQDHRIAVSRPPNCPPALFAVQSQLVTERGPNQILFCDSQEVISTLIASGYAFSLTADLPQVRIPGLRYIPLPEIPPLSFGAVYLSGNRNPALRRLLSYLQETFQEN